MGLFREGGRFSTKIWRQKVLSDGFQDIQEDALSEVEADLMQGADMVIIKPAMAYLDILYKIKGKFWSSCYSLQCFRRIFHDKGCGN